MKASAKARADRMRETVAAVAFRNAGLRNGMRGCAFLVCWGLATEALGHPVNMFEYVNYWKGAQATAYRERLCFQASFPGHEMPGELWASIRAQVQARDRATAVAQGMAAGLS